MKTDLISYRSVALYTYLNGLKQLLLNTEQKILSYSSCTSSYLELRNGADSSAPILAKLCGSLLPGSQRSSGAVMYLRFRSDSSDTHVGFNAKYSIGNVSIYQFLSHWGRFWSQLPGFLNGT